MADGAKTGAWDLAFLATDPDRAGEILFTAPYVEIDSTYLVPAGSPIKTMADVDKPGVRIAVSEKSAYDLYLTRTIKAAQLVPIPGTTAAYKHFVAEKLDVLAGLKPALLEHAVELPGSRILDGRFSVVRHTAGTVRGRNAGAAYLTEFVEDVKASGLVAQWIEKSGVKGLSVAPLASK